MVASYGSSCIITKKFIQPLYHLSETDTGSGIDSEILPMLFTKSVTKSTTGTGLGLFISKITFDKG